MHSLRLYAPAVLRYAMSMVVLWFGIQQILHVDLWTAYVPPSIVSLTHLDLTTIVKLNGWFEIVGGVLLAIGWQVRIVALLLGLHLFDIMYVVGYGEIGVRDFGLAVATLSVCMHGADVLSLGQKSTQ